MNEEPETNQRALIPWAKSKNAVLSLLKTSASGLTPKQVEERLGKVGKNILEEEYEVTFWKVAAHEVREPMIMLLIVVGLVYSILGNLFDALTILAVIVVLVFVEIYNEYRAKRVIASLGELASPLATVIRKNEYREVNKTEVVPGDLLDLRVGQRIAADARLIESYGVQTDESLLTGEATPVVKDSEITLPENTALAERKNMVYAATVITRGRGQAIVVATGMNTELGRIAGLIKSIKPPKTPLQKTMKQLAQTLVWVAIFFSGLIAVLGFLQGRSYQEMILTGLSLAFATVPEELPIVITVVLALGSYALSKKNVLIKHLKATETLGSVTVVATDKTGTLTENKLVLTSLFTDNSLKNFEPTKLTSADLLLLKTGVLVNDAIIKERSRNEYIGDPIEIALIESGKTANVHVKEFITHMKLVNEIPFDNQRKMMAKLYAVDDVIEVFVKGAPEKILENTSQIVTTEDERTISPEEKEIILETVDSMAKRGLRVLAFAYKKVSGTYDVNEIIESDLHFIGLAGFYDPPRKEAKEAIAVTKKAGIKIIMVTGDHPTTAESIAKEVGIDIIKPVLLGQDVDQMDSQQLREAVKDHSIVARATPESKLRIVKALKDNNEIVTVTGDGINDAPALKQADVGITLGRKGTEIARESSDMILLDDNFASIVDAIKEGRKLFDNLRKGITYYLAVKFALVSIFLLPIILSFFLPNFSTLPFAPIQIIVLEIFMDLAASATFVTEAADKDIMIRKPRDPNAKFIDTSMKLNIFSGSLSLFIAVSVIYGLASFQRLPQAQSMAFATWILCHIFLALNMRSERESLFSLKMNKMMIIWSLAAFLSLLTFLYIPQLHSVFRTAVLEVTDWILIIIASFVTTFWLELKKVIQKT